jgi:hypothetical protein
MVPMTLRMICVLALVLAGCGEEDGPGPPPIGPATMASTLTAGVSSATDSDPTDTDTGTSSDLTDTGDSTGASEFVVLSGAFVDGGAAVALPIDCRISFYSMGQIEPSTAMELGGFAFQVGGFTVDAYPQSYEIHSAAIPMVERGAEGYVAAECDGDGDGLFDDDLVGYHPGLPLQLITVPASEVFIPIVSR